MLANMMKKRPRIGAKSKSPAPPPGHAFELGRMCESNIAGPYGRPFTSG